MTAIKIPVALFSASTKDIRAYCAFLDFKCFNSEGRICPPFERDEDRFYYRYWRGRLIARGWARECGKCFTLASYQEVWRSLGISRTLDKNLKRHRYHYRKVNIEDLPENRKEYSKILRDMLLKTIAGNKVRQIRWRLKSKRVHNQTETFISSRTVARLVGLRSAASGSKYRSKLFNVIQEPVQKVKDETGYRYKCKKIAL